MSRSGEIFCFPEERASKEDTFRCRKCRAYLFAFENLSPFHKKKEPVNQCSAWYIDCDNMNDTGSLMWIKDAVDKSEWTEGKLYCPRCTSRIGSFNFTQGVCCSCFTFIIPAIWIQKCKVDQILSSETKLNIRLPKPPDNNTDGSSGSPMYYLETSQTGFQSDQTCSQSGPSGFQTTGLQTRKTCNTCSQTSVDSGSRQNNSLVDQRLYVGKDQVTQAIHSLHYPMECNKMTLQDLNEEPEKSLQISAANFNYMLDKSGKVQRRKSRVHEQNKMNAEFINPQHEQACLHQKRHQDLPGNEVDGPVKTEEGSRFHSLTEITQTTADISSTEMSQECWTNEAEDIPERFICAVCLELLYEPLICPCNHVYCDSCLRLLNSKSRHSVARCPLCRKSLYYVYPALDLREEIKKLYPMAYRERHKVERRAPHRRLPLPNGRMRPKKGCYRYPDVAMPYSILVFLGCVLVSCGLCLGILFVFCSPTRNQCVTIVGYEWMNG